MSEVNRGQADVIQSLVSLLNSNQSLLGLPTVRFDELSTSKDSACLTVTETPTAERVADVTGTALRGSLTLTLIYRVMSNNIGNKDLDYISVLDKSYEFIRQRYAFVENPNFFIDNVTEKSGGTLEHVYSGGIKDFCVKFVVSYQRCITLF